MWLQTTSNLCILCVFAYYICKCEFLTIYLFIFTVNQIEYSYIWGKNAIKNKTKQTQYLNSRIHSTMAHWKMTFDGVKKLCRISLPIWALIYGDKLKEAQLGEIPASVCCTFLLILTSYLGDKMQSWYPLCMNIYYLRYFHGSTLMLLCNLRFLCTMIILFFF